MKLENTARPALRSYGYEHLHEEYKATRKKLHVVIIKSKSEHFKCVRRLARISGVAPTRKAESQRQTLTTNFCANLLNEIVTNHFPQNVSIANLPTDAINTNEAPLVSEGGGLRSCEKNCWEQST